MFLEIVFFYVQSIVIKYFEKQLILNFLKISKILFWIYIIQLLDLNIENNLLELKIPKGCIHYNFTILMETNQPISHQMKNYQLVPYF